MITLIVTLIILIIAFIIVRCVDTMGKLLENEDDAWLNIAENWWGKKKK